MSNTNPGLRRFSRHRYTIKQLLDLSQEVYVSFDLSKFSFDAARAGVIPPLGECAAVSRRTSATRSRISSSEAASTAETVMAYRGGNVQEPERRPQNPPSNLSTQQNTGFARFLKKHSSPTHQRVTAGGRIVPMESHSNAPPAFLLPTKTPMTSGENEPGLPVGTTSVAVGNGRREQPPPSLEGHLPAARVSAAQSGSDTLRESPPIQGWISPSLQLEPSFTASEGATVGQFLPPTVMNNVGVYSPSFIHGQFPQWTPWQLPHFNSPAPAYPMTATWPYNENVTSPWTQSPMNDYEILSQQVVSVQNKLNTWSHHYEDLDEKLKALNRHRAMTSLNTDIASERRALVQQRSDSKDMINKCQSYLDNIEQLRNGNHPAVSCPAYNVDAPSYVPISQQWPLASFEAERSQGANRGASTSIFQKPQGSTCRRPIPIVPPPKLQTDFPLIKIAPGDSPSSPVHTPVDEWGVKIGSAPPELKQQQTEMAESLHEALSNSSPSNQSRESLQHSPPGRFPRDPSNHSIESVNLSAAVESNRWTQHRHSRSMSDMKPLDVEQLFAALRKAKGTVTQVALSNGSFVDVEGQELRYLSSERRPESEGECVFEDGVPLLNSSAAYNARRLQVLRLATTTPVDQAIELGDSDASATGCDSNSSSKKENLAGIPTMHRKAATDMFLAHFSGQHGHDKRFSEPHQKFSHHGFGTVTDHTRDPQRLMAEKAHDSGRTRAYGGMPPYQQMPRNVQHPGHTMIRDDQRYASDQDLISRSSEMSADGFSNKGYSLVSLQNVHAVAQLPQSVDGATDGGKGSRSLFSFVGKVKSPRFLNRNAANNGAWYGPNYREAVKRALVCNEEQPRQRSPQLASK